MSRDIAIQIVFQQFPTKRRKIGSSARGLSVLLAWLWLMPSPAQAQAQWVHFDANHTLAYYADNLTNRLPDFSYAGYKGGGVPLPVAPVKQTLSPVGGDNTASIQNALNAVSALAADTNGFRGAVLLKAGTYPIAGSLTIGAGGVVLRGEGNNTNSGTVLRVTGLARNVITFSGSGSRSQTGSSYAITDNYVPLGATSFHVSSAASFAVGNQIVVQRPQTQPWINAIGMSNYWTPGTGLQFERQITAINGSQVTIDAPLCSPIEQAWTTGQVYQITDSGRLQQAGLENLCGIGQIDDYPSNILAGCFVVFSNLKHGWMRDILMAGWGNGLSLNGGCKWCTVQDCQYTAPGTGTASAAPAAYTIGDSDQMCLFQRCTSDGGYYHIMVTQAGTAGPNVFLNFASSGTHYNGGPHQRWATGALHDNIVMAADSQGGYTPYLAVNNRGGAGSGQGWAAGFSLMYNCQVPQFQLEQPAVTNHYNWVIGGIGSTKGYSDNGVYDSFGTLVSPKSLYLEQLKERAGGAAVENIGYSLFTLTTAPAAQVVPAGGNASYAVTLGDTNGFGATLALSVGSLPPGATAAFNPASVTGSGASALTVSTTGSTPPGVYTIAVVGAGGGVSHTNLVTLNVGGSATSLIWASTSGGIWDATNAYNWFNPALGLLTPFSQGASVLFDDTVGVTTDISISSGLSMQPSAFTNNSSTNNFTLSGPGKISGATGILKAGASTLTLNSTNDFTGAIIVLEGILRAGNTAALGAGSAGVVLTNSGTLDLNGLNLSAEAVTISGGGQAGGGAIINSGASQVNALKLVTLAGDATFGGANRWDIRGGGASLMTGGLPRKITKTGTNQVSLVAVSPIDAALGDIDVQQGTLAVQTSTTQLGDPNGTLTVRSNAILELWTLTSSPLNKRIVLGDGATIFNEKGPSVITGPVLLQGSNIFNTANAGSPPTLTCSNALSGPGSLIKSGAGTLALTAANPSTGATLITAGTLALSGSGSILASGNITVSPGATLDATGRSDATLSLAGGQTLIGGGSIAGSLMANSGAVVAAGVAPDVIGTLAVGGGVALRGTTVMKLTKSGAATNDVVQAGTSISYGGSLSLTNLGGSLRAGDSFKLFNAPAYSGAFTNVMPAAPGSGLCWDQSRLAADGTLRVAVAPSPAVTAITLRGANLRLAGTNGIPGGTYYLLGSTNLSLPRAGWTRLATNPFDGNGNFILTNVVDANSPPRFYLLQMP